MAFPNIRKTAKKQRFFARFHARAMVVAISPKTIACASSPTSSDGNWQIKDLAAVEKVMDEDLTMNRARFSTESSSSVEPVRRRVINGLSIQDIVEQAGRALDKVEDMRESMLAPRLEKKTPVFTSTQVAAMCEIDKSAVTYRANKGELPKGTIKANGSRREFTLAEAREWVQAHGVAQPRPPGAKAFTLAVTMFKGGSTKTTTTMALAQGLTLRGYRVLVIDTDPQNSLTSLCGVLADAELNNDQSLLPLFVGEQSDVRYAIRETYWDGLDLIPATSNLAAAEFHLPSRQMQEREHKFRFWEVLDAGLDAVRDEYDMILIDTPPSLSYTTINAMWAADGLIVPICPGALDFLSSAQFWAMFGDLAENMAERWAGKQYSFISVLLSRVNTTDTASAVMRKWITDTYQDKVLPVVIPATAVASYAAAKFGTVYDIDRYEGSQKTYQRARQAYDQFCELIEQSIVASWNEANR